MITESLKTEILLICQNVMCGAKLAGEFSFIKNNEDDYKQIIETIKLFPELKYKFTVIDYEDWCNCFIYKYDRVSCLISAIDDIKNRDSVLYHFLNGKLFGYNDFEVMEFINKNCAYYKQDNQL